MVLPLVLRLVSDDIVTGIAAVSGDITTGCEEATDNTGVSEEIGGFRLKIEDGES